MFRERISAPCPAGIAAIVDAMTADDVLDVLGSSDAQCPPPVAARPNAPPSALDAEAGAILKRCETRLLELDAELAAGMGQRVRAWWLRARAAARRAP
jgi:hypothetical protein